MADRKVRPSAVAILAGILDRPVAAIPDNASIHNFPAWDSLAHVKLMLALEDLTGRPVDPARIATMAGVEDIDLYLADALNDRRL
jgi:acyl carrier protein